MPEANPPETRCANRLSWKRFTVDGTPVVGWECQHCGHEIEHRYQPTLLKHCPSCGGNQQGVRRFEPEPIVEERRKRLAEQLAERYGPEGYPDAGPSCTVCETTDDVHIDPGDDLESLEYRCDDHRRFEYQFWWQPGDHPSLLTRRWIETCDDCGAEFTGIFGVTYRPHRRGEVAPAQDYCLQCLDADRLRRWLATDERRSDKIEQKLVDRRRKAHTNPTDVRVTFDTEEER